MFYYDYIIATTMGVVVAIITFVIVMYYNIVEKTFFGILGAFRKVFDLLFANKGNKRYVSKKLQKKKIAKALKI